MNNPFHQLIFGPIHSRRLGKSLGINVVLPEKKFCNFNCIYCECGLTETFSGDKVTFPHVNILEQKLSEKLSALRHRGERIDSITFSGNGEPTLHPEFLSIVHVVIRLRNTFYPEAKISVLSNSTMLHKKDVVEALSLIENPILKLDAPTPELFYQINQPAHGISFENLVLSLQNLHFPYFLQTIFLEQRRDDGTLLRNFDESTLEKWVLLIEKFNLKGWMIYPVDRPTPYGGIRKLTPAEMGQIYQFLSTRLRVPIMISY